MWAAVWNEGAISMKAGRIGGECVAVIAITRAARGMRRRQRGRAGFDTWACACSGARTDANARYAQSALRGQ